MTGVPRPVGNEMASSGDVFSWISPPDVELE